MDHRLHERLADALRRAAVHLPLDEQGVDDPAAVVHHHVTQQGDLPGLGIDLDHGDVCAVGEGHVHGVEEIGLVEARRHAPRQVVAEMRLARHVGEGHGPGFAVRGGEIHAHPPPEDGVDHLVLDLLAGVCGRRDYPQSVRGAENAVLEGEVLGTPLELMGGDLPGLVQELASRLVDGRAADRHGARVEGAGPERHGLGVALHDLDLVGRQTQHVGRDLGEARRVALPGAHRPGEDGRATVGVDDHAGALVAGPPKADRAHPDRGPNARTLGEGRDSDPEETTLRPQGCLTRA